MNQIKHLNKNLKTAGGIIIIAILLLYGNTLFNGYSLDDEIITGPANSSTQSLSNVKEILTGWYQDEMGKKFEYRPVVKLSFALENQLFGLSPGIHHFFNMVYYALCCMLLFRFLLRLFDGRLVFSLFAVLLFVAHPMHTEVVASLKNRDVLLAFIFSFLAGNLLLGMFEKKQLNYWVLFSVLLFFYLATLSKRDALIYIFIFPLILWLKYKPRVYGVLLVALIIAGCYVLMQLTARAVLPIEAKSRSLDFFENPLPHQRSWLNRLLAFFNSAGFYMIQDFLPFRQVCYYGYNQVELLSAKTLYFFSGVLSFAGCGFLFFKNLKKDFILNAGLVFLIGGMGLYLNIRAVPGITADRFCFVSTIGAAILMALLVSRLAERELPDYLSLKNIGSKALGIFSLFIVVAAVLVIRRNSEWKDKETLFKADVEKAPRSAKLHSLYALELIRRFRETADTDPAQAGRMAEAAKKELRASLDIYGDYTNSQSNLGYLLLATNDNVQEARLLLEKAVKAEKNNAEIILNYADAQYRTGDFEEAEKNIYRCLEIKNDVQQAYSLLVKNAAQTRHFAEAADRFRTHLPARLKNEAMFTDLGNLYARGNDTLHAIMYYDSAVTVNPANKNLGKFLYRYYSSKNRQADAERIKKLFRK